jgi:hypothetical protein
LAQIEREILRWDGVFKKRDENGPGGIGVTGYRYGDPQTGGPQIGHVHDDGHADFRFPREVKDELIRDPSSRVSEQPDDGELPDPERGGRGRSPGTVPHELRAK